MKVPDRWKDSAPEDVIRESEYEIRCELATLVATEVLRHETDIQYVDWYEGTASVMLGHFDNLLACARALANQHKILVDYIRQVTPTLDASWKAGLAAERARTRPPGSRL